MEAGLLVGRALDVAIVVLGLGLLLPRVVVLPLVLVLIRAVLHVVTAALRMGLRGNWSGRLVELQSSSGGASLSVTGVPRIHKARVVRVG